MCHHDKFVPNGHFIADIWPFFIFQDGTRPSCWIHYRHIGTTHDDYLVASITMQNFVGIDAVVSTMRAF